MSSHRKPVPCLVLVAFCVLTASVLAQEGAPTDTAQAALEALKSAPSQDRPAKRAALVALGSAAVDPLVAVVTKHREASDTNCIGHCLIALGELKAEEATSALMDVLQSHYMQFAYEAASALGSIWQGKGSSGEQAKLVNAALLGMLHSDVPDAALYGPGLALVKINDIPIQRPEGKTEQELAQAVDDWFAQNPDALPSPDKRPWQLNLLTVLNSDDYGVRQVALDALRQSGQLGPVEPMLSVLAEEGSATEAAREELAGLLGELTGIPFPPPSENPEADPVVAWRWLWFAALSKETDERHVAYAWGQLEASLRGYFEDPNDDAAGPVKFFRAVLIYQLADPSAIPAGATPRARDLLSKPLGIKKRLADAVAVLESKPGGFEKATQLDIIQTEIGRSKAAREVGLLFLSRLSGLAREEADAQAAKQMGAILSKLSGIPCDLERSTLEKRREVLDKWEETVRRTGVSLEAPAA
jgi:hypothetical protein